MEPELDRWADDGGYLVPEYSIEEEELAEVRAALRACDAAFSEAVERMGGTWDGLTEIEQDWVQDIADRAFSDALLEVA